MIIIVVFCNKRILADKVKLADSFMTRFKGLMGIKKLDKGQGLLLRNCSSIHCFFMKIKIDVIYLSENMTVLYVETLKPWRNGKFVKQTAHVLELPEHSALVSVGDVLEFDDVNTEIH